MNKFFLINMFILSLTTVFAENAIIDKIEISISKQKMYAYIGDTLQYEFTISTSKYGLGSRINSFKTPLGKHVIYKKIGDGAPLGTIFKSRINTGKIAKIDYSTEFKESDLVTSRIMRLKGLEKGKNDNSYNRMIYIHGTAQEGLLGQKVSHGCIRMKNKDVIELFDHVKKGTIVDILQ